MTIHINYAALVNDNSSADNISEELLKKAKSFFSGGARKELLQLFDAEIRLMAMEVAQRQVNPQDLYQAGTLGLLEALEIYDPGKTEQEFKEFALPFVRTHMLNARSKAS